MIAKVILEIISNWLMMGILMALLFVLCYYFAVGCEKISDKIRTLLNNLEKGSVSHK